MDVDIDATPLRDISATGTTGTTVDQPVDDLEWRQGSRPASSSQADSRAAGTRGNELERRRPAGELPAAPSQAGSGATGRRGGELEGRPDMDVQPRQAAGAEGRHPDLPDLPDSSPARQPAAAATTVRHSRFVPRLSLPFAPRHSATGSAQLLLSFGAASRPGEHGANQDFFLVSDNLVAVADGVGGLERGDIASALALSTIVAQRPQRAADKVTALEDAVRAANKAVRAQASRRLASPGMATTTDVVLFDLATSRPTMTYVHVGDGTIWHCPAKGAPRALTEPHAIPGGGPLLLAVGQEDDLQPDRNQVPVVLGDRIVLSTDGLTSSVEDHLIIDGLVRYRDLRPQDAASLLLELAVDAETRDDTTVIVVDVVATPTSNDLPAR